jgi:hypothetical protein
VVAGADAAAAVVAIGTDCRPPAFPAAPTAQPMMAVARLIRARTAGDTPKARNTSRRAAAVRLATTHLNMTRLATMHLATMHLATMHLATTHPGTMLRLLLRRHILRAAMRALRRPRHPLPRPVRR